MGGGRVRGCRVGPLGTDRGRAPVGRPGSAQARPIPACSPVRQGRGCLQAGQSLGVSQQGKAPGARGRRSLADAALQFCPGWCWTPLPRAPSSGQCGEHWWSEGSGLNELSRRRTVRGHLPGLKVPTCVPRLSLLSAWLGHSGHPPRPRPPPSSFPHGPSQGTEDGAPSPEPPAPPRSCDQAQLLRRALGTATPTPVQREARPPLSSR